MSEEKKEVGAEVPEEVHEIAVSDELYWLEFGTLRLVFNDQDYLIDRLHEFQEGDPDAKVILWKLHRTENQMKATDMNPGLAEFMAKGIARAKERRARLQTEKLLKTELDVSTIASVVGLTEKEVEAIKKEVS